LKKRVTIEDVARASHVSVATVSLVMRGRTGINIETRKRVEQVARALGYQRRRSRNEQHVQRISVLMRQQSGYGAELNMVESHVLHGIEDVCRRRGIRNDVRQVVFGDVSMTNKPILFPLQYEYGGVISVGVTVDDDISNYVRDANIPCVFVDVDPPSSMFDSVHVDYEDAVSDLVGYLVAIGHRSVALIDTHGASNTWQATMKSSMRCFGMLDPYWCTADATSSSVQAVLYELFQRYSHVSTIICRNDVIAMHVVQQLQHMGRYVPQSISVVGFHDVAAIPDIAGLTTIRVDAAALGALAVQTLLHRIEWPNTPRLNTTIQAALVIRQSTQPHIAHL
jgi:LacI family transcriptional regulator